MLLPCSFFLKNLMLTAYWISKRTYIHASFRLTLEFTLHMWYTSVSLYTWKRRATSWHKDGDGGGGSESHHELSMLNGGISAERFCPALLVPAVTTLPRIVLLFGGSLWSQSIRFGIWVKTCPSFLSGRTTAQGLGSASSLEASSWWSIPISFRTSLLFEWLVCVDDDLPLYRVCGGETQLGSFDFLWVCRYQANANC